MRDRSPGSGASGRSPLSAICAAIKRAVLLAIKVFGVANQLLATLSGLGLRGAEGVFDVARQANGDVGPETLGNWQTPAVCRAKRLAS